jgi:hypothetical protein
VNITQQTDYPWNGKITFTIDPAPPSTTRTASSASQPPASASPSPAFDLHIRIPGWATGQAVPGDLYHFAGYQGPPRSATGYPQPQDSAAGTAYAPPPIPITVNGQPVTCSIQKGYAVLHRKWNKGDKIVIDLPMPVRKVMANERVKADLGRFAFQKGPIVYCLEGPDYKDSTVKSIVVDTSAAVSSSYQDTLLNGIIVLVSNGSASARQPKSDQLITTATTVKAIPYYSWNNRGSCEMEVWIPYEASAARPKPAPTIASGSTVTASIRNKRMYGALNDQYDPADSKDNSAPYLHWWPKKNSKEWVQYDFNGEFTVSSSKVYWFDDGPWGGCRVPASWKLYYRKDGEWIPVNNSATYGTEKDKYNQVNFDPVKTTALRLELQLPADNSSGIHEWIVE